jgi:L-fuculose-phosphate aldolase
MSVPEEVLATAKTLLERGLVSGTSGNVSGRMEDGRVCITPSSIPYDTMTLDDLTVIDLDGTKLEGDNHPSSEWQLHTHVYAAYDEIGAVIHAHPVHTTMFAITRRPIPPVIDEFTMYVGGEVPVCDYAPSGTPELADHATTAVAEVGAALLANHGMVAVGPSLKRALHIATLVERAAEIVHGASLLDDLVPLPDEVNANFVNIYKYLRQTP